MQDMLFPDELPAEAADAQPNTPPRRGSRVQPWVPDDAVTALARKLPPGLRLGGSTWSYPGWQGLVWAGRHSESTLSKTGLPAYATHPLLRAVGIDRGFYRPLAAAEFQRHAEQVPRGFRFTVKAPSIVTSPAWRFVSSVSRSTSS